LSWSASRTHLLHLVIAGSVDDGKSTLLGRLLFEMGAVYEDQLAAVAKLTRPGEIDFSLITDGLQAEREQRITIDVAYRYFSTPKQKFIVADVPGHEQYTRNMVTGSSTADVAVIVIDVNKGILEQSRRHTYLASLLGIRHFIFAINKMDLVDFDEVAFEALKAEGSGSVARLDLATCSWIPVSALHGDNLVRASDRMHWYTGPTLLSALETFDTPCHAASAKSRFLIQNVIRPDQRFRGYAGQVLSGIIRTSEEVVAIPSMRRTAVKSISLYPRQLCEAPAPLSIVIGLRDHIDLGRGHILSNPECTPNVTCRFAAKLVWLSRTPSSSSGAYLIRHLNQTLCGSIVRVVSKTDTETFTELPDSNQLFENEIGTVEIETHKPIFCDSYCENRATGSFIVIDPVTNDTVAGGLITSATPRGRLPSFKNNAAHPGLTVWFTGLSGSGKTSVASGVQTELLARGLRAEVLDADDLRQKLNSDLGFSRSDRDENVRRIGFVSRLLSQNGVVALVAAISPYQSTRDEIRRSNGAFLEVFVDAPLNECERRDPKGLYRRARSKEIVGFTGIDDPYEPPPCPDVHCQTSTESLRASVDKVVCAVLLRLGRNPL
jgi:bifunctional enzyme CysN/CysC